MGAGVSLPGGRENALSDFKPSQGRYPYRRTGNSQESFRTIQLTKEKETHEVAVIGTTLRVALDDITPDGARSFIVQTTHPYHVDIRYLAAASGSKATNIAFKTFAPFEKEGYLLIDALRPTNRDIQIVVDFDFVEHGQDNSDFDNPTQRYHFIPSVLWLRLIYLSIDVDTDRDGYVEHNSPFKDFWNWGMDGCGPILAMRGMTDRVQRRVHFEDGGFHGDGYEDENDRSDAPRIINEQECTVLKIRSIGSENIPKGYKLSVSVNQQCDEEGETTTCNVALYLNTGMQSCVIGPGVAEPTAEVPWPASTSLTDEIGETEILAEGYQLFDGTSNTQEFVPISLAFSKGDEMIYEDRVELRVCPWIVPSPLADPKTVYVVDNGRNSEVMETISTTAEEAAAYVVRIDESQVTLHPDNDALSKWMCFGFTQTVQNVKTLIAVSQPQKKTTDVIFAMGPDSEYFTLGNRGYFDKMMPTPAMYPDFPLGALLVATLAPGGEIPGDWKRGKQEKSFIPRPLGGFLEAQRVQALVEVFTDWLETGDVSNMVNFVPCKSSKGFKVVMPSIHICRDLLIDFRKNGEGFMCEGKSLEGKDASVKVTTVLDDREFWKINQHFQNMIDWNKQRLRWQLDLRTDDFIEIPALWQRSDSNRAVPFFPNMTGLVTIGNQIVIPRPHGPKRHYYNPPDRFERYIMEEFKIRLVTAKIFFVDEWEMCFDRGEKSSLYKHVLVQRRPGSHPAWWQLDMR